MKVWFDNYVERQAKATLGIDKHGFSLVIDELIETLNRGGTIFVAGNGGSAANASHFATDLGKGASDALQRETGLRNARFKVVSLPDNVSWITAIGNDYSYSEIFWQQLKSLASQGDLLICISVSGMSLNLLQACLWAQNTGIKVVSLVGRKNIDDKNCISKHSETCVVFQEEHYGRVEDAQMNFLHMLCYYLMENAADVAKELRRSTDG